MTLSELISEKEQIGIDLMAQDLGIHSITFIIENVEPNEVAAYAADRNRELGQSANRLRIFCPTNSGMIDVVVYSSPVKINKTITYERV